MKRKDTLDPWQIMQIAAVANQGQAQLPTVLALAHPAGNPVAAEVFVWDWNIRDWVTLDSIN